MLRHGSLIGGRPLHAFPRKCDGSLGGRIGNLFKLGGRQFLGHLRLVGSHNDDIVDIDTVPLFVIGLRLDLDARLVGSVPNGKGQRLPFAAGSRSLCREHGIVHFAVGYDSGTLGRNDVGTRFVIETQEVDRNRHGLGCRRKAFELRRHDPAAIGRNPQLHITRVLIYTQARPLFNAAVDAVGLAHRVENVARTVGSRRNHIGFRRLRAIELLAGAVLSVRAGALLVVRVIAAPFEQVEAHAEHFVRRTYVPRNIALEFHDPVEFESHMAHHLTQRHGHTGDRHRNRTATFVLDHRLIGAADAEPLGGKAVERGFDFHHLFAESLVIGDFEHCGGFRIGLERPRNHGVVHREMTVGLCDLDLDLLTVGRFQINVSRTFVAGITLGRNGHPLVIASVTDTIVRRDGEPVVHRSPASVRTLDTRRPRTGIAYRDLGRGA